MTLQLLYDSQVCLYKDLSPSEAVQSKFLSASSAILRIELGQVSLEAHSWYEAICFWFNSSGLTLLILLDSQCSCSVDAFSNMASQDLGRKIFKQWIWNTASQAAMLCLVVGNQSQNFILANYLYTLEFPKYQRAFTFAHFNCLPSALLRGRY